MLTLQLCCFVSINCRYTFKHNWHLDWDLQCTRRKSGSVFCVGGGGGGGVGQKCCQGKFNLYILSSRHWNENADLVSKDIYVSLE